MAHAQGTKDAVRNSYVNDKLALAVAAVSHGVPDGTARRWKAAAKAKGDDWDLARAASRRADGPVGEFTAEFIEEFTVQVQQTFQMLREKSDELSMDARVKTLTSLTDMMSKVMKVSGGDKRLEKRTIAADVIKKLAQFVSTRYPQFTGEFVDILQAFAPVLDQEIDD